MKYIKLFEEFTANRVMCDNCDWSWEIEDGGKDVFICHKCGHDNSPVLGESINEALKFKDLLDTYFDFKIGSGTTGTTWNKDDLTQEIKKSIKHNLFDWDFYYNWTDDGEEYFKVFENETLKALLKNIDKTLSTMFLFKNNKLTFNIKGNKEKKVDEWFQTNKTISKSLKQDYYKYRDEYWGVKL